MIIGQMGLLEDIDFLIERNHFAHFTIIYGVLGSGKRTISEYIAKKMKADFIPCEIDVDTVRQVIDESYSLTKPTVYMFADTDRMSITAKNALLKITEEPPANAYFIVTIQDITNMLVTLQSRATTLKMCNYSFNELLDYARLIENKQNLSDNDIQNRMCFCTTPYDVQVYLSMSNNSFAEIDTFTNKFIDNLFTVSLANLLKVSTMLRYKVDEEKSEDKFDYLLFLRMCMQKLSDKYIQTEDIRFYDMTIATSENIGEMRNNSLNKQAIVDNWLIELKELSV